MFAPYQSDFNNSNIGFSFEPGTTKFLYFNDLVEIVVDSDFRSITNNNTTKYVVFWAFYNILS